MVMNENQLKIDLISSELLKSFDNNPEILNKLKLASQQEAYIAGVAASYMAMSIAFADNPDEAIADMQQVVGKMQANIETNTPLGLLTKNDLN